MKKKLTVEMQNSIQHLKGSYFDGSQGNSGGDANAKSGMVNLDLESLLNRKVNIQDFQDQLSNKTDKNAFIKLNDQVNLMHEQVSSLANILHQ